MNALWTQFGATGCRIIPASPFIGVMSMMSIMCIISMLGLIGMFGALALAQSQYQSQRPDQNQPLLRPIDQRLEGANELATSLRTPFTDLRLPLSFDRLYEVDPSALHAAAGVPKNSRLYARASAGLIAVFPRTDNRQLARGIQQVAIPPGTVYLFADSAKLTGMNAPRVRGKASQPSQPSLLRRIEQPPIPQPALPPPPAIPSPQDTQSANNTRTPFNDAVTGPSIWDDETLRQTRVSALIDRAYKGG